MVAGAAYVPSGVRRIIPSVFLRSTPLRSLMIFRDPRARYLTTTARSSFTGAIIRSGKYLGWEKGWTREGKGRFRGRNDRLEICVAILGDYYSERGECIKTRDEASSYATIMAGVGREQFHVRS